MSEQIQRISLASLSSLLRIALIAQFLVLAGPWVSQAQKFAGVEQLPQVVTGPYRIQPGDVMQVKFFKSTQLNQTVPVGPDGGIFLPLIGRVDVLERTIDDVNQELLKRYDKEMIDPQITLSVNQYSGMLVYVGGEVNVPGVRAYRGGLTLVQAIMDAGGFSPKSRLSEVVLIRNSPDSSPVGTVVDVKEILRSAQFTKDVPLAPADVVFVPRKRIANLNLFIDQYLTKNIPFNLFYPLNE